MQDSTPGNQPGYVYELRQLGRLLAVTPSSKMAKDWCAADSDNHWHYRPATGCWYKQCWCHSLVKK
jgi:hypothetical protein